MSRLSISLCLPLQLLRPRHKLSNLPFADRILRFARLVGRENAIAGTDCGFAQAEFIQRHHPTVISAKFETLVEGARLTSAELRQKNTSTRPAS
jgi:hypothetical protein